MNKKIALVTGGNRGIGFEVVKGLLNQGDTTVWLGARDLSEDITLTRETILANEEEGG